MNNLVINDIPIQTLDYYRVEKAIQYIYENLKSQPTLKEISEYIGINEFDLQKSFKRWAGVSPKKFLEYLTLEHAKKALIKNSTEFAAFDSGLSSTSRLHDLFINIKAVTPAEYKKLGKDLTIKYGFHNSRFGKAILAITSKGLCYLNFVLETNEQSLLQLKKTLPNAKFIESNKETKEYANKIFDKRTGEIKIFVKGTNFQVKVWKALLQIPEGKLSSYKNIANQISNPKALRAVGTAIGSNPIAYLIPCHRVINSIGKIGNYSGGIYRKPSLIGWEASKSFREV